MSRRSVVGVFDSGERLLAATQAARAQGYPVSDAFTPYPVHGMDEALGLPKSILPKLCFLFGATGAGGALAFQAWVSVFDWPMNVGGKSFSASPALIPVAFELTVLFAGLGTVASFLVLRRLWPGRQPAFAGLGATDDRFLLVLREREGGEGAFRMRKFLEDQGAVAVEEVRG